jgi:hypothetical protein
MRKLLLVSMLSLLAAPSFAAVTLLNHQATGINIYGTQTTPSFNSSGASLLVVAIAYNQGCGLAFTDSLANTWTALPPVVIDNNYPIGQIWYAASPNVGSAQTITLTSTSHCYADVFFTAWAGTSASPFDRQVLNWLNGVSSVTTGSIAPAANNELLVSFLSDDNNVSGAGTTGIGVSGGISLLDAVCEPLNNGPCGAFGYAIQTTATAINPTWVQSISTAMSVGIAAFQMGTAAPVVPVRRRFIGGGGE